MSGTGDRLIRIITAMLPPGALAAAGVCLLPPETLLLILCGLMAWTFASVPIGVLVGHCALGGD